MAKGKDPTMIRVKRLEMAVSLLSVVVALLCLYIVYPSIRTAVAGEPAGQRLSGIDSPLDGYALASINNASNNYFEIAGEKLLNLSIPGEQYNNASYSAPLFQISLAAPARSTAALVINGKPSVVYIGAISCIYCGESRWAMALALSRFGSFKNLYTGYSSFGDGDLPTLYWISQNYTTSGMANFGNQYQSNYINFYSVEYDSPITGGFKFPASQYPVDYFIRNTTNQSYLTALRYMNGTNLFQGTPFTLFGSYFNRGAGGVVFGNATSTSASTTTNLLPLSYMTHQQIYDQFTAFNSTWAYEEYAAADVYVAEICPSINNSAPVCSLPAIKTIESRLNPV